MNPILNRIPPLFRRLHSFKGRIFLVGGPVRDLLLKRPIKDLDFLIEGGPRAYHAARRRLMSLLPPQKGSVRPSAFYTLDWRGPSGWRVDCARPRKEDYPKPGGLPHVKLISSALQDLSRRDFTANSIALGLSAPVLGEWLDPTGGRADIERRLLRILHPASFEDDPTRILRALRFSERLGFEMEEATLQRLNMAVRAGALKTLSWERLRDEFLRVYGEENWPRVLRRISGSSIASELIPAFSGLRLNALDKLIRAELRFIGLYALVLFEGRHDGLPLSRRSWPSHEMGRAMREIEMLASGSWRISLKPALMTLAVLRALKPDWAKVLSRKRPAFVDGRDLRRLGIAPERRSFLQQEVLKEVLSGEIKTRREAFVYLKSRIH